MLGITKGKTMLSSRENTIRLFGDDAPERVGLRDGPWGATVKKWVTQGYPTTKVIEKVKETEARTGLIFLQKAEEDSRQFIIFMVILIRSQIQNLFRMHGMWESMLLNIKYLRLMRSYLNISSKNP